MNNVSGEYHIAINNSAVSSSIFTTTRQLYKRDFQCIESHIRSKTPLKLGNLLEWMKSKSNQENCCV